MVKTILQVGPLQGGQVQLGSGQLATSYGEAGTVPASSPYTVSAANAATFADDYGVVYAATGLPLAKVAAGPAAGQYSESAGIYTFASADAGKAVLLSYTYGASPARASSSPSPIRCSAPRQPSRHSSTPASRASRST
ncbi:MAG: hypothetical protein ACRED6_06425 [Stellaceae bacterium]